MPHNHAAIIAPAKREITVGPINLRIASPLFRQKIQQIVTNCVGQQVDYRFLLRLVSF
jgi:hypothetical protein